MDADELDREPNERNARGSVVARSFHCEGDRYQVDALLLARPGWQQYDTDQDAWYYGVWVNLETRQVVTYAEGDLTKTTAPDEETMRAELAALAEFHGPPPPAFVTYDRDDEGRWTRAEHYADRPAVDDGEDDDGAAR